MRNQHDVPGWTVQIVGVTVTLFADGPPYCPDEAAAKRQALDILRMAAKESGVFLDLPDAAGWTIERDE